ncbi:MAG: GAF domain-containing protein [Acidobacteriota bacterium]|nr:GAF domain-containing protein [Acidobacteriota bacterium]MDH3530518.1 GAF domain-containing protein [Acidobacteriota bacterium]
MGSKEDNKDLLESAVRTNEIARTLNVDLERAVEVLLISAARALGSEGASIIVTDDEDGDLVFLKAIGKVGDQLEGVRIPAGKGIAGFVAVSGQPLAISDVGQEESFYAEIDKKTGFSTEILLATPLSFDGGIIGVLEFINRTGDPPYEPFTTNEMDTAAIYAESIGALVYACQASRLSADLAKRVCEGPEDAELGEVLKWVEDLRGRKEHKELLELAVLVKEIGDRGSDHRKLCRELLLAILGFAGKNGDFDFSDV